MRYPPFSWDAPVDFVQVWPGAGYRDTVERMTMRQAVDAFLRLSEHAQRCCAIEPIEPYEQGGVVWSCLSFDQIIGLEANAERRSEQGICREDDNRPERH